MSRPEASVLAGFGLTVAAAIGLAAVYLRGGQPQLEGSLLAIAFGGLAYGLVTWGNTLLHQGTVTEARHHLGAPEAERDAFEADLERGGEVARRTLLLKGLAAAAGALGVAALFPIRSLGPRPGRSLLETPWRAGLRLVTDDGRPVNVADVPLDGLVTVFPEGHAGSADGQAVLMRVAPGLIQPRPGRAGWSPRGFIAYSKVCTHAGCPVGLYEPQAHTLLCPCHQSTFDVLRGARPVFGPAAAPLPQLPLAIDASGFLVARGDFSDPVGPSFWHRS
jgi:ubiquinol-cytochrome c reductase iron-sulfur subunit